MMIHDIVLKPMSHPPFLQDYRIRERLVMLCSQDVDGCFCMTACMVPNESTLVYPVLPNSRVYNVPLDHLVSWCLIVYRWDCLKLFKSV